MAFGDPLQWIVIGVIVIVIFLWGPQKIPDLARALGRARKEFENASKEMNAAMSTTPAKTTPDAPLSTSMQTTPDMTADQALMESARKLGITTEGKTRSQISKEIVERARPQA